jgi:hypothetical protein
MTTAEMYKQLTGADLPRPFAEKTPDERTRDWEHFLALVNEGDEVSDADFDTFLKQANSAFSNLALQPAALEDEDAA